MQGPAIVDTHSLAAAQRTDHVIFGTHRLAGVVRHVLFGTHVLSSADEPAKDVSAIGVYLSGGTSNTDPNSSLGGQISSEQFQFQSFIQKTTLPGVTIKRVGNSGLGTGVLQYQRWGDGYVFKWIPRGADSAFGRIVNGSGEFGVLTAGGIGNGHIVLDIDFSLLSGSGLEQSEVEVTSVVSNLFSDLKAAKASVGMVSYRCLFIKNERTSGTLSGLTLSTFKDGNTGSEILVGVDPAGVGNGVSTGVATTPADEETDPGMMFKETIDLPDITPGDCLAVWFRRNIPIGWYKNLSPDVHLLLLNGGF